MYDPTLVDGAHGAHLDLLLYDGTRHDTVNPFEFAGDIEQLGLPYLPHANASFTRLAPTSRTSPSISLQPLPRPCHHGDGCAASSWAQDGDREDLWAIPEGKKKTCQTFAHIFRPRLRLGPRDVGTLLAICAHHGSNQESQLSLLVLADIWKHANPSTGAWATLSVFALFQPLTIEVDGASLNTNCDDDSLVPIKDDEFAEAFSSGKSLEQSNLTPTLNHFKPVAWYVVVHFKGKAAATRLRQETSSFIVPNLQPAAACQVHVVNTPICAHRYCLLVPASKNNPDEVARLILATLQKHLDLRRESRSIVTRPFGNEDGLQWFRPDGDLHLFFKDRLIAPMLREATACSTDNTPLEITATIAFVQDQPQTLYVIWTRQGNEDSPRCRKSIPRQLSTLLLSPVFGTIRRTDKVMIVVEICSSSKRPIKDRRLFRSLPSSLPIQLLTVNADRLTRRAEDVDQILEKLHPVGGTWHTQGFPIGEDGENSDWHTIKDERVEILKERLIIGRQRALQMGFYWRRDKIMTRLSHFVRSVGVPKELKTLRCALRSAIRHHDFTRVYIIVRISFTTGGGSHNKLKTSTTRQQEFLPTIAEDCGIPVELVRAREVSAYKDAFTDMLDQRLSEQNGRSRIFHD